METAAAADIAIVFINALSGEEYIKVEGQPADRVNLDPWHEGNELVSFTATAKKPVIVVVHSVGPIILEKILAQPNVVAVVWAGLPGQESGNALVDVLYGDVSPNGKLPYTIAKREQDYRTAIKKGGVDTFDERVYIDYRQFDKNNVEPRYEFGYGLCELNELYGQS
jgi:beta-glucosidase